MDPKTFFVIYPSYMDSCKTMKLGRRIGIENSIPTPTVNDISEGLQILNLRHVIEPYKGYSRDITALWDNPGRVKVEPIGDDGEYTKRSLLIELSSIIITLPSRIRRIEVIIAVEKAKSIKREEQLLIKKTQQLAITSSSNQSKSSTTKNKKKGKKKR
jgi:signal recognition particle subunit SRP19